MGSEPRAAITTSSLPLGTPTGVQLAPLCQSLSALPYQVLVPTALALVAERRRAEAKRSNFRSWNMVGGHGA